MSPRAYIVSMLASLVLFACGGAATQEEAKSPEGNPWAGYTGKYAGPATSPSPSKAKVAEAAPVEEAAPADADAKSLYGAPADAKPAAKKAAAKKKPAAKKATAKKKPAAKKRGAKRAKR